MALNSSARWPLSTDPDMQIFQWTVIQSIWLGPMHQTDLGFTRLPYRPIVLLYNFGAASNKDGDDEEGWWWYGAKNSQNWLYLYLQKYPILAIFGLSYVKNSHFLLFLG